MGGAEAQYRSQPPGFTAGSPGGSSLGWHRRHHLCPSNEDDDADFPTGIPACFGADTFGDFRSSVCGGGETQTFPQVSDTLIIDRMMKVKSLQLQLWCCCSTLKGWSSEGIPEELRGLVTSVEHVGGSLKFLRTQAAHTHKHTHARTHILILFSL